jgi:hypothetical protein
MFVKDLVVIPIFVLLYISTLCLRRKQILCSEIIITYLPPLRAVEVISENFHWTQLKSHGRQFHSIVALSCGLCRILIFFYCEFTKQQIGKFA